MFLKIAAFKTSLQKKNGVPISKLYFVKVDVQSCFDTIPLEHLLSIVDNLLSMEAYETGKNVGITSNGQLDGNNASALPRARYVSHSRAVGEAVRFDRFVGKKTSTVFVNTPFQQYETKDHLMRLLREHIQRNFVKIGKRYYQQTTGISQGSVLSSILCNLFYAEFEREVLSFALTSDSPLLRLLDDFCIITTKREYAERFIQVMHAGNVKYGISIQLTKSLANFAVTCNGYHVPKYVDVGFPYCGVLINTHSLDVSRGTKRAEQACRSHVQTFNYVIRHWMI
jgi:telomerase reverse transcriptase